MEAISMSESLLREILIKIIKKETTETEISTAQSIIFINHFIYIYIYIYDIYHLQSKPHKIH